MRLDRRIESTGRFVRRGAGALLAVLMLAAIPAGAALAAEAEETRLISNKWALNFGGYLTDFSTTAAVGSSNVIGTVVRLEDQLGLDDEKSFFRLDGLYRFNSRHAIGFGYWGLKRSGVQTLQDTITWQGVDYDVGVTLDSTFNVSWVRADWRYSFLRNERGEAGIVLGISAYDLTAALEGDGMINMAPAGRVRGEETLFAPIPTYGIFINFGITRTILFRANLNFLNLDVGDIDGKVVDLMFVIDWYPTKHFGFGGGSARTAIDYTDSGTDPLNIDYSQSGFVGYLSFVWGDVD